MNNFSKGSPRVCIIGAGPSGITTAKNLLQQGLTNFTVFEKSHRLGGNWVYDENNEHSSVYETTHIISSNFLSSFEDFPMPFEYPVYPSHVLMLKYFEDYARYFGVEPYIRFNTKLERAVPVENNQWKISYSDDTGTHEAIYDYLLVANGHHWDPCLPKYPGEFKGELLHSHQYKKAASFKDKRVLVIGGGNSACDIAVEISQVAQRSCISMRNGQHIFPKFIFGKPTDLLFSKMKWLPFWLKQKLVAAVIALVQGRNTKYFVQNPTCKPLQSHPTINSQLFYSIRHGKVFTYFGLVRFEGNTVHFTDGRQEDFDTVIFATGYKINFPFFDKQLIDFSGLTRVPLYRKMMHPEFDNLYFIGLFQPQGCIWPLADYQAKIAAKIITGRLKRPANLPQKINKEIKKSCAQYKESPRHALEVDYHIFRRQLLKELKKEKRL